MKPDQLRILGSGAQRIARELRSHAVDDVSVTLVGDELEVVFGPSHALLVSTEGGPFGTISNTTGRQSSTDIGQAVLVRDEVESFMTPE